MASKGSFDVCMGDLADGDSSAANHVFERFVRRLVALAHARMSPQLQAKIDPEDVVQSTFGSFFDRHAQAQYHLENWESLWALLARITVNKCARRAIDFSRAKRAMHREEFALDTHSARLVDRQPTPEEAAVFAELLQTTLASVRPKYQEVILLRLQQYSIEEISARVGRTERTVYRVLNQARKDLEASYHEI